MDKSGNYIVIFMWIVLALIFFFPFFVVFVFAQSSPVKYSYQTIEILEGDFVEIESYDGFYYVKREGGVLKSYYELPEGNFILSPKIVSYDVYETGAKIEITNEDYSKNLSSN